MLTDGFFVEVRRPESVFFPGFGVDFLFVVVVDFLDELVPQFDFLLEEGRLTAGVLLRERLLDCEVRDERLLELRLLLPRKPRPSTASAAIRADTTVNTSNNSRLDLPANDFMGHILCCALLLWMPGRLPVNPHVIRPVDLRRKGLRLIPAVWRPASA